MKKRDPRIARAMFWDALILLALSVYELLVRLDASWGWAKGYFLSHIEAGTRLSIVLKYIPYDSIAVWFYMLACAALSVWVLCSRRTRRASAWMLAPALALTAVGFALHTTIFGALARTLKLLPLVFLTLLCLAHALIRPRRQRREPIDSLPVRRRHHRRAA